MPSTLSLPELPKRIQGLLEERQHHAGALAHIDKILAGIGAALGGTPTKTPAVKAATAPATKAPATAGKKRKLKTYAVSGPASILAFVKANKNPTSQEISKHWKDEGRAGKAKSALTKLVTQKKLKRTPLGKGIRGSRYSLA